MRKLTDYEGTEAIEVLADILEPAAVLAADKELLNSLENQSKLSIIVNAMKKHPNEVKAILAAFDRTPVEEYKCNLITIIRDGISLLNDRELLQVFHSQSLEMEEESSGSATAITEDQ